MKNVQLIGTNGENLGKAQVKITTWKGRPNTVLHAGLTYRSTGKEGTDKQTGELVFELSSRDDHPGNDARIWTNAAMNKVWED
jgi:hypothetical protein